MTVSAWVVPAGFVSHRVEMANDATLRDAFAAQALIPLMQAGLKPTSGSGGSELAATAYAMADHMLRARKS